MYKILISPRLIEYGDHQEQCLALDTKWVTFLQQCGYLPIIAPFGMEAGLVYQALQPDGLLLTGGNDLSCVSDNPLNALRDEWEMSLLRQALLERVPVWGVCRGMQLINHYFGGTLKRVSGHIGTSHALQVHSGKFHNPLKALSKVNAFHSFGIDKLGAGLEVTATAQDGCIKAVQHSHLPLLGIMWHSERQEPFCKYEMALVKAIFTITPTKT